MAKKKTTRKKTPKHPNQKTVGRTLAKVDDAQVEALASICCTQEEIAIIVGCSVDTLQRRFAVEIENGRATAKASLRRQQFKQAMNGHTGMLVWLGKQLLGQRDKSDVHTDGETTLRISELIIPTRVKVIEGNANGNGHQSNGNGATPAASRLPGPN